MYRKLIFISFLLLPNWTRAADPQILLEEAVAMVGSGEERTWNNLEIGQKLRDIRQNFPQTPQSLSATAFLAFYLTQIPGDNAKETYALCDEVKAKAPKSWQAWMANIAKISTLALREGEDQQTLDAAIDALAQTNGAELSRDSNVMSILKPVADQWPLIATDFTDIFNSVVVQRALVLGQYKLGEEHLSKIVNPRIKASGEGYMADYLREHPQGSLDQPREKKRTLGTANDSDSSASPQSSTGSQQVTELPFANTSRRDSGKFISWFMGLVVIGGIIFFFYQRLKRKIS